MSLEEITKENKEESFLEASVPPKKRKFVKKDLSKSSVASRKVVLPKDEPLKSGRHSEKNFFANLETEKNNGGGEKIRKELLEIYENEDGTMPDMKQFQVGKGSGLRKAFLVLLVACLFLGGVAWAGFFAFQPKSRFNVQEVVLNIIGDEQIEIGQEVKYRIKYQNDQGVPLSKSMLQVRYPEGFVFEKSSQEPTNDNHDEWVLGTIGSNEGGYIDIFGKFYGSIDEQKSFRAFFNYTPGNFSSEFQKVSNLSVKFVESPIEISVDALSEVTAGSLTTIKVKVHNKTEKALNNLSLILVPGKLFNKTSSTPLSDLEDQYRWVLPSLVNDQSVEIKGVFNNSEGNEITSSLNFKVLGWQVNKDNQYVYAERQQDIKLVMTNFMVNLAINGARKDLSVQPGETLNGTVVIKNSGQTNLSNLFVKAIFEAPAYNDKSILDWVKFDDPADGTVMGEKISASMRRATVTWDPANLKELKTLAPGEQIQFDWHLPIKSGENTNLSQYEASLITARVEVKGIDNQVSRTVVSDPFNLVINSDLSFEVRDKISNDAQNREIHNLTWLLSNSFHDLRNLLIEAEVYGDVTIDKEAFVVPAGKVEFDEQTKKIVWRIDSFPTSMDILGLQMPIILNKKNPTQTNLTSKVKIKANDTITNQDIIKAGDEVLLK